MKNTTPVPSYGQEHRDQKRIAFDALRRAELDVLAACPSRTALARAIANHKSARQAFGQSHRGG